ncbi:ATP-binding protein [Streptomyces sp. NPDC020731]|uniref:ATP-binding protein n=1 Tax=Streptomyces sp. NPDC020731 TaxID=3365085 RepID=UPI0037AACE6E
MTTTVSTPHTVLPRRGGMMTVSFAVTPRPRGARPPAGDAARVGAMRRIIAARLRYWGLEAMNSDVTLIVSELLTNALLHSGTTEISLTVTMEDGFLLIAVRDGMPGSAAPKTPDDKDECGRGLQLVQALVEESGGAWGTGDNGAETWCSLAVPAGAVP